MRVGPRSINYPDTNGCFVCDCGNAAVRVGLIVDSMQNNYINVLECTACGKQLPIPCFTSKGTAIVPFRPPRLPDVRVTCPTPGGCDQGELCRVMHVCIAKGRPRNDAA